MTKKALALLEKVFTQEVLAALTGGKPWAHLYQPRGKALAEQMVAEGLLVHETVAVSGRPPTLISGYALTHYGRYVYGASCRDCPEEDSAV